MLQVGTGKAGKVVLPDEFVYEGISIAPVARQVPGQSHGYGRYAENQQIRPPTARYNEQWQNQYERH